MSQNYTQRNNQQKSFPTISPKIENGSQKNISKIHGLQQYDKNKQLAINNPQVIKGGLIGIAITALIRLNMIKYSRIGIFSKRWGLVRQFIKISPRSVNNNLFSNYYIPNLQSPAKNFMCYSGQAGIGKSNHFMNLVYKQSSIRPALYLSFKFAGKDNNSFEEDVSEQVGYGENSPGILSQTIKAIKKIDSINRNPFKFWLKILFTNILIGCSIYGLAISSLEATYGMFIFSAIGISYAYYLNFIYPLIIQSLRRTCPLIVFDDLNKIQQLNMFPEIVRYLQVLDNGMANVILISPDQDTWCRLRRQPGVKDRLRVKQIYYDHLYTAESILKHISDDNNFESYMKNINGNKLYTKNIVISLVKELIGRRQVTLRRFTSILILNDQQEYEKLVNVLIQCSQGKITTGQAVQQFTNILYESQTKTMLANLKSIKRQVKLSQQQFMSELKVFLKKRKLPSDNQIAPHLKAYSIARDLQSDYIFNGRFMFTVFNLALKEYEKDWKDYKDVNIEQPTMFQSAPLKKQFTQISADPTPQNSFKKLQQTKIKDWNNSNTIQNKNTIKIQQIQKQ